MRLVNSAATVALLGSPVAAASSDAIPDLSAGGAAWRNTHNDFILPKSGAGPVTWDPAHPYFGNGDGPTPTSRVADLGNPTLMPWVKEALQKFNADALAGKPQFTPVARCWPNSVPGAILLRLNPMFIAQTPKEVLLLYQSDHQTRHVYLDVPHSMNVKPSWYGESVGHFEGGDTLVIDTIGLNTRTFVDNYRTPHTDKLHVIERWRVAPDAQTIEVSMYVEDPGAFTTPWRAVQRWRRVEEDPILQVPCNENNDDHFSQGLVPLARAETSDF
jgi:hypothetical protein